MASTIVLVVLIVLSAMQSCVRACNSTIEFTCDNGNYCFTREWVCDYYDDCKDNSDERSCRIPTADNRTALVYTTGFSNQSGSLWKLFGNPADYAYELGDSSYNGSLPIHLNYVEGRGFGEVAVDYQTNTLYFNNRSANMLQFGNFIYEPSPEALLSLSVVFTPSEVKGMAFDWLSKNLYWTNGKRIAVTKFTATQGYTRTLVFPSVNASIQDLAVDAVQRYLFWYDSASSGILIRTDLAGNNRVNLTISSPATRLALDCTAQTVYFLDTTSGRLASISYNGTSYTSLGTFSGRSSIAVDSQFIYMGDNARSVIYIHRKQDGSLISNFTSFPAGPIRDITVFSQAVQPAGDSSCATNNGGCSQICLPTSSDARVCGCEDFSEFVSDSSCRGPCTTNNGGCSQMCLPTSPTTRVCRCRSGYTLSADGLTCAATSGNCDSLSQFRCNSGKCPTLDQVCDYYEDCGDNGDEKNCGFPSANNDTAVVFTTGDGTRSALWKLFGNPDDYVNKLTNESYKYALPIHLNFIWEQKSNYFGVIAVDFETKWAYFNNLYSDRLEFGPLIYEKAPTTYYMPMTVVPKKVSGIAVDWLSKNIYWTNGNSIMVTRIDWSKNRLIYTKTLFTTSSVQDIAVDPNQRYLFWFDSASANTLTRADLAGGNRNGLTISSPATRLALDCNAQTVYFLDPTSGRLASIRYDGTSYTLLGTFSGRGSIAVHSSYIFLGDSTDSVVYIHDKATGALVSKFTSFSTGPVVDIKTFSRPSQPAGTNPCATNNGGCAQICFATSSTAKSCGCKDSDGLNCGDASAPTGIAVVHFQHWIVRLASVLLLVMLS